MPSLFFKSVGKSRAARDGKSQALTEAGIRLLALKDYDAISMARIAREANCSVGALYARYLEKTAYLYRILGQAFHGMGEKAKLSLDNGRWRREPASRIAKQIVSHVVAQMTAPRAAGVIRATIKLATVKPQAMGLFENYRSGVTELAVDLLGKRGRISPSAVRIGMQVVLGTITDAVLQKHPGAMNAGSPRMTAALTNVLSGYLGLLEPGKWAEDEADGEDDPAPDLGTEEPPELAEGEIAIFDPDLRTYRGKTPAPTKQRRKSNRKIAAGAISRAQATTPRSVPAKPLVKVAMASPRAPPPEPSPKPLRKPKHRFI